MSYLKKLRRVKLKNGKRWHVTDDRKKTVCGMNEKSVTLHSVL